MATIDGPEGSTYASFRRDALLPNEPILLPAHVSSSWACLSSPSHSFTTTRTAERAPSAPAYANIAKHFGDLPTEVIDCAARCTDERTAALALPGTVSELLGRWEEGEGRSLYLKDWHLPRILAEKGRSAVDEVYDVPAEWADDWLNAFWADDKSDDFRFLYLGGGDTFTPLHRDVFGSYSISTNLHGEKLWTLFPPQCAPDILDLLKQAERDEEGDGSVDVRRWSVETRERFLARGMREVTQRVGESIFIPSGWHHQVQNLSHPTFSLNHNWINAHNILSVYDTLEGDAKAARESIEDVRELLKSERTRRGRALEWRWEREFEVCVGDLLRQNVGWDWTTFWSMVRHALVRIAAPSTHTSAEWPLCPIPATSQPPTAFVVEQVSPILARFKRRLEMEWRWVDGLEDVLSDVEREIERLKSS